MKNYRIFVEKLPRFRVEAESLRRELNANLNLQLGELRLLCVYDLFGFSEELLAKSRYSVFGEVVTDEVTDTCDLAGRKYLAVEFLPGQFDQRAASAVDCVRLIDPEAEVEIRSSKLLIFDERTTDEEVARIRRYYINAVEAREKDLSVLGAPERAEVKPVPVLDGFRAMEDADLEPYCKRMGLAMNADDLREVVRYFRAEGRDPYETELRILDTYWSDHCRHNIPRQLGPHPHRRHDGGQQLRPSARRRHPWHKRDAAPRSGHHPFGRQQHRLPGKQQKAPCRLFHRHHPIHPGAGCEAAVQTGRRHKLCPQPQLRWQRIRDILPAHRPVGKRLGQRNRNQLIL